MRRGVGGQRLSTDSVMESRTGTDVGARVEVRLGEGRLVPAAGLWVVYGCQRTLSRTHGRERMGGARAGVRFGEGTLSMRRDVGFGGRVCGGKQIL